MGGPPCSKYAYVSENAVMRNKLEAHVPASPWVTAKTASRKDLSKNPPSLAPNHYRPDYKLTEQQGTKVGEERWRWRSFGVRRSGGVGHDLLGWISFGGEDFGEKLQ